jgi:hypothetical protein
MILYELALMGAPSQEQIDRVAKELEQGITPFGLKMGKEVSLTIGSAFSPSPLKASAALFFGGNAPSVDGVDHILRSGIPIIPIASRYTQVSAEIPKSLQPLNCLAYEEDGYPRVASALMECVGLLPKERRVFVSYRRNESRNAALQLFDELSARHFDVFIDTHAIGPGEDFQAMLWHKLCDSDVLVMLDTPGYFESRWTAAEFGRALTKGISVLRVGWPGTTASKRAASASKLDLLDTDFADGGALVDDAIERVCVQVEALRSQSHAVRGKKMFSEVEQAVTILGGVVSGVGLHRSISVELADGQSAIIYPTVGIPTSVSLHDAINRTPDKAVAVLYDAVGIHDRWLSHLTWLGQNIPLGRYLKAHEIGWTLADWVEAK